jgi:hypothetical protein
MRTRLPSFHGGITARGASSTDAARRQSRHHAGGPQYEGPPVLFLCPDGARSAGRRRKEWRDEATEDADDAHDDAERSDTMTKDGNVPGAMLSIGETATLAQAGMQELRTLLFRRKKQREKQRT